MTLDELNLITAHDFVARLGAIFEHSPWVAQRAAERRPFDSTAQLLQVMCSVVEAASPQEQLALINAHPKLGARGANRQSLTASSAREQSSAGLDALSHDQYAQLERLNAAYEGKFSFPFILAVRGHDPQSIIANCEQRLHHDCSQEMRAALHQIGLIAGHRLADLIPS